MRKIVPPTTPPRTPAAPPRPPSAGTAPQVAPRPRRDVRIARAAFWVCLGYVVVVLAWRGWYDFRFLRGINIEIGGMPLSEPWVLNAWGYAVAFPTMALASLLALAALGQAARGRYAAGLLITYALIMATLLVIQWSAIAGLLAQGEIRYLKGGLPHKLHIGRTAMLVMAPIYQFLLCLPLLIFAIAPLRRASFTKS